MAKLTGKQIQELAKTIIAANPGGIRYTALVNQIWQQNPETPENTIHGNVWDLEKTFPDEVTKPSRGLYTPARKTENDTVSVGSTERVAPTGVKVKESDFYAHFAEWPKNELDENTEVASLGGAVHPTLGMLAASAAILLFRSLLPVVRVTCSKSCSYYVQVMEAQFTDSTAPQHPPWMARLKQYIQSERSGW